MRGVSSDGNQTFSDDRSGSRQYAIGNFTTNTLQILNVSNPWQPQRVMSNSVTSIAGRYTATFQIAASAPVTYFVSTVDQIQSPKQISRYAPADLGSSNGADYLIITHAIYHVHADAGQLPGGRGSAREDHRRGRFYNQFTDGHITPSPSKTFEVRHNWPKPRRPTCCWSATAGFKNFSPAKYGIQPNLMPPNLAWVDPQGEVDSASELVCRRDGPAAGHVSGPPAREYRSRSRHRREQDHSHEAQANTCRIDGG
jgi:hypothetical protein